MKALQHTSWAILAILLCSSISFAGMADTVHNGSFEDESLLDRPPHWYIGFKGEELPPEIAEWALDESQFTEGIRSLRLTSHIAEGCFISQILDGNSNIFSGSTVSASVDVLVPDGVGAQLAVLAVNETLAPDPDYGIGLALKLTENSAPTDGEFVTLSAEAQATDQAAWVVFVLSVWGTGTVWFDNASVQWDQPDIEPMPEAPNMEPAFDQRDFGWGWVNENPANNSDDATHDLVDRLADYGGDTINLFAHVRYNQIAGLPLTSGFDELLMLSSRAMELGINRVLTFDFTHDTVDSIGDLNPMPDGSAPGEFDEEIVQSAMSAEMLALIDEIEPMAAFVGIEIDFLYRENPQYWDAYVDWYFNIREDIKDAHPDTLVSIYTTDGFFIDEDGNIRPDTIEAFNDLHSGLDTLSYSTYPYWDDLELGNISPDYFSAIRTLDPTLPIALPEFGVASINPPIRGSVENQDKQVEVLQTILDEIAVEGCAFATLYCLFDQTYIGSPDWFQVSFGSIGMHDLSYSPKLSAAWFMEIAGMAPQPPDDDSDDDTQDDDFDDDTDDYEDHDDDDDTSGICGC